LASALAQLDALLGELEGPPGVFLDFDGTLASIVEDPDEAQMPAETRPVLAELADTVPVAIVSGRGLADLTSRVGLSSLVYAGDHGFELAGVDTDRVPRPDGLATQLAAIEDQLADELADLEGVHLEAKRFSLAVHHRQAGPEASRRARWRSVELVAGFDALGTRQGKRIVELVPAVDWDKGRAVELLCDAMGDRRLAPIYVGDDATDETAFTRIEDGVGVLVADQPRQTAARYRLRDPDEVRAFLEALLARWT